MIHVIATMTLLALTHIFCLDAMAERKFSVQKSVLIYALFAVFFVGWVLVVFALFGPGSAYVAPASYSVTIIAAFFMFILVSADTFCKKLFLFISYSNLFCILFCIVILVCNALFPELSEAGTLYVRSIGRTLLYIPAVLVYLRILRPYIRAVPGRKKRTWYSVSLVSTLFLLIFSRFVSIFYLRNSYTGGNIYMFAVVLVLYCSTLWVVFGTIQHMKNESRMELISQNVEYLQGQLALEKENELAAKAIRHDFRHHIQNIAVLIQEGEVGKVLRYIEQYEYSLDAAAPAAFCPHVTVNAILSNFCSRAQKEGVQVSISADTPRKSPVADMDFVAILSNLLENALNGCRECDFEGEIKVNIRTVAHKTVIVCRNPCRPDLAMENNMPQARGTGIDSVILAARKYNGEIRYSLEDGNLTACVILSP